MSLYIFDQGNTLLRPLRSPLGFQRQPMHPEEQVLRAAVFEKIAELRAGGHAIAIASNQDGVAWGAITLQEAQELVENCAEKIGGVDAWAMSPYQPLARLSILRGHRPTRFARDDRLRKPHPGMILDLMQSLRYGPDDTYLIGDKKSDEQAANAAGVRFIPAKDFFNNYKPG